MKRSYEDSEWGLGTAIKDEVESLPNIRRWMEPYFHFGTPTFVLVLISFCTAIVKVGWKLNKVIMKKLAIRLMV